MREEPPPTDGWSYDRSRCLFEYRERGEVVIQYSEESVRDRARNPCVPFIINSLLNLAR